MNSRSCFIFVDCIIFYVGNYSDGQSKTHRHHLNYSGYSDLHCLGPSVYSCDYLLSFSSSRRKGSTILGLAQHFATEVIEFIDELLACSFDEGYDALAIVQRDLQSSCLS